LPNPVFFIRLSAFQILNSVVANYQEGIMKSKLLAYRILFIALGLTSLLVWNAAPTQAAPVPVLIKDIKAQIKDNSSIDDPVAVGSTLYFSAWGRAHGNELWKSDGRLNIQLLSEQDADKVSKTLKRWEASIC
jgi:hypothetical protein